MHRSDLSLGVRLLRAVRDSRTPTIAGGPYPTFAPDVVLREPGIDMVCVGEGEEALVELCQALRHGRDITQIGNLWVKTQERQYKNPVRPPVDLDRLPFQDWEIYDRRRFFKPMGGRISVTGTFEMNRGCPYACTFCINSSFHTLYEPHGGYYREKNIDRMIDEMVEKKERYQLSYVYLVAESFLTTRMERIERFARLYKDKVGLPFWVEVRPESVTPPKVALLKEIGCEGLSVGVESGNVTLRKTVLGRHITNDTILRAFDLLRETGIRVSANNMIGFPTETRAMVFDTIALNRALHPDGVMVSYFSPYKGCHLRERCEADGLLSNEDIAADYRLTPSMDMPQLRYDALVGLRRAFPLYVKFPETEWDEIRKCEALTAAGDACFQAYAERYRQNFM